MNKNKKKKKSIHNRTNNQRVDASLLNGAKSNLDDTFTFGCKNCAKCCRCRNGIILYPHDLFYMAKFTGLSVLDFSKKYCIHYLDSKTGLLLYKLKVHSTSQSCIMLKDGKCSAYDTRPASCTLHPLARFVDICSDGNTETGYLLNRTSCCSKGETYSVKEWLEKNNFHEEKQYMDTFVEISESIINILDFVYKANLPEIDANDLAYVFGGFLYLEYDINMEFLPQYEKSREKIIAFIEKIKEVIPDSETNDAESNPTVSDNTDIHKRLNDNLRITLDLPKYYKTDLILTPYDIFHLSNNLKLKTYEFCEKYCDMTFSSDLIFPRVELKQEKKDSVAILEWLENRQIVEYSEAHIRYQNGICEVINYIREIKKKNLSNEKIGEIICTVLTDFYFAYEPTNDFFSRFEHNKKMCLEYLEKILKTLIGGNLE